MVRLQNGLSTWKVAMALLTSTFLLSSCSNCRSAEEVSIPTPVERPSDLRLNALNREFMSIFVGDNIKYEYKFKSFINNNYKDDPRWTLELFDLGTNERVDISSRQDFYAIFKIGYDVYYLNSDDARKVGFIYRRTFL